MIEKMVSHKKTAYRDTPAITAMGAFMKSLSDGRRRGIARGDALHPTTVLFPERAGGNVQSVIRYLGMNQQDIVVHDQVTGVITVARYGLSGIVGSWLCTSDGSVQTL